ncbi:MAG: TIGR04255 family protein [Gemmataceae bacterium]|nr:TIGR04255 family protein [Gemmataceae bacterium]
MAFGDTPRLVLKKNPVEEAKCQVSFPPILAIAAKLPSDFQEVIRLVFPLVERQMSVKMPTLPSGIPPAVAKSFEQSFSLMGEPAYLFSTEDKSTVLNLSQKSLVLTTKLYDRWESLRDRFLFSVNALVDVYRPAYFTHTCVKYKNSVRPGELDAEDRPWSSILAPWVAGPLGTEGIFPPIKNFRSNCSFSLPDEAGTLEASFGLVADKSPKRFAFSIESHTFHSVKKGKDDVASRLDVLQGQAGSFFRSCFTNDFLETVRSES